MPKTILRTKDELARAQWAEKFTSVSEGVLYKKEGISPFPIHEYFKLGLLGKNVRMLELNAGAALIDQLVADTVTDMTIDVGGEGKGESEEEELRDWFKEIFYSDILEQTARAYFGNGYGVQQVIRDITEDGKENSFTTINVDPATWYPTVPTFKYEKIKKGRVICTFSESDDGREQWYAFVETHEKGSVQHELYKLENNADLEGAKISLNSLERFNDLDESVKTELDFIPIFQIDRTKNGGKYFGESILAKVWGNLQEISEIKTQIRQERIKHFRAKFAAPIQALSRAQRTDDSDALPDNSKQAAIADRVAQAAYDMNQEIFPIPPGGQIPQYIQRDLEIITKGCELIDKCLSEIAFTIGAPRSIFNLDEKGTIHVETEKKKDRRYMKHVLQAQRKMEWVAEQTAKTYWQWKNGKELTDLSITLASPFEMTIEEKVEFLRLMNADDKFVSQEEAVNQLWPDMTPEQREEMLATIKEEDKALTALAPVPVDFPQ